MMKLKNIPPGIRKMTFSRWSRKPFAVFASLNKVIKIAFMANAVGLILAPTVGFSQTDTLQLGNHVDVDEVVITGECEALPISQLARPITIISAQSVSNCPQQSLTDLLEYQPSIDLRQRGLFGTQADISIRGGSFDQNVILLNGINFTDPQTGHLNLSLPIESDDVSKIEILQGPAGYAIGANAFSGTVNFTTPTDTVNRIKANVLYGDYKLYKIGASAQVNVHKWNNFVAISNLGSDGYKPNTGFNTKNIFYRGILNKNKYSINYQLGYTDKAFGSNGFYSLKYPEQFEENIAWLGSVGMNTGKKIKFTTNLYNRLLNDHYLLIKSNPTFYENYHQTNVYGMNSQIRFQSIMGRTIIGFDIRKEHIQSNRLGEVTGKTEPIKNADSVFYDHFFERKYMTTHLEQTYQYRKFKVVGGAIIHVNLDQHSSSGIYPGIDVGWQITRSLKPYVSINQSFRMPTFTDLFYLGRTNIGNRELKPEKVTNYEAGLVFYNDFLQVTACAFYKKGTNIIDWVINDTVTKIYEAENISTLNTRGTEINVNLQLNQWIQNNYFFFNQVQFGFTNLNVSKSSQNLESMYALDQLKLKCSAALDGKFLNHGIIAFQWVYQDREGYYDQVVPNTNEIEKKAYDPFFTLDVKVGWHYKWLYPYIEATNITNSRYFDFNGLNLPGRWFKAGIKFDLSL